MSRAPIVLEARGGRLFPGDACGLWTVVCQGPMAYDKHGWKRRTYLCRCKCGLERAVLEASLLAGKSTSCGPCTNHKRTHGLAYDGGKQRAEYRVWKEMRERCADKDSPYHGARGITVCDRWQDFGNFFADMGPRPSRLHSIDRRDNDGNYEPSNCRWATSKEQVRNRRVTWKLDGRPVAEICEEAGVKYVTVQGRVRKGWPQSDWFIPAGAAR